MATERDWYDTPLYYDIIFDADTPREAAFLEALHQRHGRPLRRRPRLLEPACGSGRLLLAMARRGWQVSGFDGNPSMLAFARQRLRKAAVRARLWQDWLQSFEAPKSMGKVDLAHILVSSFKYLLSEQDACNCLRRIANALHPGGLMVLGIHLSDYQNRDGEVERWSASRGRIKVRCETRTQPAQKRRRLEDISTCLSIRDGSKTHRQITHWQFRTYNAAQLRQLLRALPEFELLACHDFQHDIQAERRLDDEYSDIVLVLRRR